MGSLINMGSSNDPGNPLHYYDTNYDKHEDEDVYNNTTTTTTTTITSTSINDHTADELEVASILLDLPNLIRLNNINIIHTNNYDSNHTNGNNNKRKIPKWVSKKTRTAVLIDSPSKLQLQTLVSSTSLPFSPPLNHQHHPSTLLDLDLTMPEAFATQTDQMLNKRQGMETVEEKEQVMEGGVRTIEQECRELTSQPCGDIVEEETRPRRGLDIDLNMPAVEMEDEEY